MDFRDFVKGLLDYNYYVEALKRFSTFHSLNYANKTRKNKQILSRKIDEIKYLLSLLLFAWETLKVSFCVEEN
jgi:hypothetical protein